MKNWWAFPLLIFLVPTTSLAIQATEDFSALHNDTSVSTAVWNTVTHTLHPPLVLDKTSAGGVDNEDFAIDVGTGVDGSFELATYSSFSVGGSVAGNIITIDTDAHPALNLTNFYLAPGWTIQGRGSNPLWFKVLGTFNNAGIINCNGGDGTAVTAGGGRASGGTAVCGGGAGGNGGVIGTAASSGASGGSNGGAALNAGGIAATNNASPAGGGGGGGGYNTLSPAQPGLGNGPGAAGAGFEDPYILKFGSAFGGPGGGSGGGGGAASTTDNSRGASGGGGGGVIRITGVGNFINSGSILAKGGKGGATLAGLGAGGGGGGGGGTVWVQVAGSYTNSGNIDAQFGTGGIGGAGGNGGDGCQGRTWLLGFPVSVPGLENPTTNLIDLGQVHYSRLATVIQSTALDMRNTSPTFLSFILNYTVSGTTNPTLLVAGSNDGFINDDTGFVPASSVSVLQGKRFLKFKVQLLYTPTVPQTYPLVAPLVVNSIVANFDGFQQKDFAFTPTCGNVGTFGDFLFLLSLGFLGALITSGRLRIKIPFRRTTNNHLV